MGQDRVHVSRRVPESLCGGEGRKVPCCGGGDDDWEDVGL